MPCPYFLEGLNRTLEGTDAVHIGPERTPGARTGPEKAQITIIGPKRAPWARGDTIWAQKYSRLGVVQAEVVRAQGPGSFWPFNESPFFRLVITADVSQNDLGLLYNDQGLNLEDLGFRPEDLGFKPRL